MGNTNTITLENKTNEVIDIIELRRIIPRKTVEARGSTSIKPKEYDGDDSQGGLLPLLMIFCGGRLLRSPNGDFLLAGQKFFSTCFKTVTIDQPNNQNSTGVVNYEVKFQKKKGDSGSNNPPLKFSRDSVLDHDYGWSVQFINESVKLTLEEGVTMILDPSKLFATINDPAITSLLHVVLKFWPRTFADLYRKVDLVKTVGFVNDLMVQAKEYNADPSKGKVDKVMEKVNELNKLCAAKVEWYHPLFPGMENKFPPVVMAEVDDLKLKKFATTVTPLLQQPNSLPGTSS